MVQQGQNIPEDNKQIENYLLRPRDGDEDSLAVGAGMGGPRRAEGFK